MHLRLNGWSPTASISSIRKMSAVVDRHGEGQSHEHAGGVVAHVGVEELLHLGEVHDGAEPGARSRCSAPRMAPLR